MKRQKSELERMIEIQEWLQALYGLGKILLGVAIFLALIKYLID